MSDNKAMDLLLQGLDQQGTLSKVKAQIKASVFKIIDQAQGKKSGMSQYFWENEKAINLHKSNELVLLLEIVKEFLQFFDFDYTLSVLNCEANHKEYIKRDSLMQKVGLNRVDVDIKQPILQCIYQKFSPKNPLSRKDSKESPSIIQQLPQQKKVEPIGKTNVKAMTAQQQTKKEADPFQFEEIEVEEDIEDSYRDDKPQSIKKNPSMNLMLTSSEEQLVSQSQGLDITVESNEIEQYDYVENIRKK